MAPPRPGQGPRQRPPSRAVKPVQLVAMLLAFVLVASLGGVLLAGLAMPAVGAAGAVSGASTDLFEELPTELEIPEASQQSVILDADGNRIATFYAENRIVVGLEDISEHMRDAVVAIEDRRFYDHRGVDVEGIARALVSNVFGEDLQGGSTLTQQYVKNVLIESGRISGDEDLIEQATETSISRKLREAKLAITLEQQVSKDDILAGYLNIAQFGPSQYGVEAASNYYFGKHASELTVGEAAMLAGITQSPARWDPVRNPENAYKRRNDVLGEMLGQGYISREDYDTFSTQPVEEMLKNVQQTPVGCGAAGNAAYFCDYVVQEILGNDAYGETVDDRRQLLNRGGLIIRTTLEQSKQKAAYDALTGAIPVNDASGIQTALSSIEPGTGRIVAMAQNTNYGQASEEDPTATLVNLNVGRSHNGGGGFQTGSTFKIFTLTQWLKEGRSLNEAVNAERDFYPASSWNIPCGRYEADYSPSNMEGIGGGYMTVLDSLKLSVNLSFVEMANQMDLCQIRDTAAALGAERGDGEELLPVPGMVLGANELTPLSMANVAATLAAGGVRCDPVAITEITTRDGEGISVPPSNCTRVLEEQVAARVTFGLDQVIGDWRDTTGYAADIPGREEAGKTGTANMDTSAWFVGLTPQLSAAVWMGHREGLVPMRNLTINGQYYDRVYGGLLPAPTWRAYMERALEGEPVLPLNSLPPRTVQSSRGESSRTQELSAAQDTDEGSGSTGGGGNGGGGNGDGGNNNGAGNGDGGNNNDGGNGGGGNGDGGNNNDGGNGDGGNNGGGGNGGGGNGGGGNGG